VAVVVVVDVVLWGLSLVVDSRDMSYSLRLCLLRCDVAVVGVVIGCWLLVVGHWSLMLVGRNSKVVVPRDVVSKSIM